MIVSITLLSRLTISSSFSPKRGLVRNLEQVAHRLGAFAIKPAHGETDFVHRLDDLVDHLAQDKAGQMEHGGGAHAGADIRRASGQITEPRVVGEIEFRLERAVHFIDELERALQLQTRADRLHPQVIFLVDHDAQRLPAIHDHGAAHALRRMFAADEVALDQYLLLQRGKVLQQFRKRILHLGQLLDARLDQLENLRPLRFLRPTGKGPLLEVPRQAHAAADHDLMMRPFAAQPFAAGRHDVGKFHG